FVEEGSLAGGFSSAVLECLADNGALRGQSIRRLGLPDIFVEHGTQRQLREKLGLRADSIAEEILALLDNNQA
ncbi:MAG: 1-deoxy-D-xylulose-5-phosphate synthase, partial [Desulfovibrionaceae bacterium]|nr:1-deoxy-D-xylulose-5-phosphate synthase [Desulfovibrionaceae bacterium]